MLQRAVPVTAKAAPEPQRALAAEGGDILFITLEGIHGAGKSVLADELRQVFRRRGVRAEAARDQVGTELSARIREINVCLSEEVDPIVESLLVAAARRQTFLEVIEPALAKGDHVIAERFTDSFYAFGHARRLPDTFLKALERWTCNGVEPDLTILLDISPETALERIPAAERHRVERSELEFHRNLSSAYRARAKKHSKRFAIIDACQTPAEILSDAIDAINEKRPGLLSYDWHQHDHSRRAASGLALR